MTHLEIKELSKVYFIEDKGIKAVDRVSLRIDKGDFISIIGHSGSGKTTLLSIIGGILRPSSGNILFNGDDVYRFDENRLSEYRADRIGYIFQFASLLPVLTVRENLLLPTIFSTNGVHNKEKVLDEYLGMVGLGDKKNAYPSQLSGGQQRRVAIARALMNDPEIILGDEPTGDLDEETEQDIMDLLKKINLERNITLILVTHDTGLAKDAARRLRMDHGKMEEIRGNGRNK
ncbi:MAG: ABC transporter ATP-binding protein [Nitrospirae bacterium]|nr:ABC transporter ATP-binding protein [Nitrospirota bacterium]